MKDLFLLLAAICLFTACEDAVFTPKPRAFPRVIYPEKKYQAFDEGYCSFTFQYPVYAKIQQDTTFFDEKPAHPCWFNIYMPDFECRIHCSYSPITQQMPFDKLKTDAFKMTDWHNKKATYINERPFQKPGSNVKGILFDIEGPVASHVQFFITDTLEQKHFLRGAVYFYTQAKPDSLAPVYEFVEQDVAKMLESFEWE